jgi:hypothetical protein
MMTVVAHKKNRTSEGRGTIQSRLRTHSEAGRRAAMRLLMIQSRFRRHWLVLLLTYLLLDFPSGNERIPTRESARTCS